MVLLAAGVAFLYGAFTMLSNPGYMASGDSLYHFGVAREIAAGTLAPSPAKLFPWTLYAALPVDHYWGFHLLLAPFALLPNAEVGMKLASAVLFSGLIAAMTWALDRHRVPFPWAWACASMLFSSQDWRYLQLRGGVTMAAALVVMIELAAFQGSPRLRRWLLLLLAYGGTLSYNGAILLLPFHGMVLLGLAAAGAWQQLRERWAEPLLTALGLFLGFCLNPYMNREAAPLRFAVFHTWNMGSDTAKLFAGRKHVEFNPFPLQELPQQWEWLLLFLAIVVIGAWAVYRQKRHHKEDPAAMVYLACTLFGVLITLRAMRMREYAVPLAFLFVGIATRDCIEPWRTSRIISLITTLALLLRASFQVPQTQKLTETVSQPIQLFAGARPLLEKEHTVVINLVQGDSTFLYWEWLDVQVASGLSPYFIYYHDHPLYEHLQELRDAKDETKTLAALRYVTNRGSTLLSARANLGFHRFATQHPERVTVAYHNELFGSVLYRILPEFLAVAQRMEVPPTEQPDR